MSTESLAAVLYRFYGELRCEKTNAALNPSSLVGIRAGMQRALQQRRTDSVHIVQDPVFAKANNMLKAKCRLYAKNAETQNRKENQRSVTAISSRSASTFLQPKQLKIQGSFNRLCGTHWQSIWDAGDGKSTGNWRKTAWSGLGQTGQCHLWCLQQLYYQHSIPQVDPGAGVQFRTPGAGVLKFNFEWSDLIATIVPVAWLRYCRLIQMKCLYMLIHWNTKLFLLMRLFCSGERHQDALTLTRALLGGGAFERPPPQVFRG